MESGNETGEVKEMVLERRKTDRSQQLCPADFVSPETEISFSPFVSKFLAFTVRRKIVEFHRARAAFLSSIEGSPPVKQLSCLKELSSLILKDTRLGIYVDGVVLKAVLHLLESESFEFQYYCACILADISPKQAMNEKMSFLYGAIPSLVKLIHSPNEVVQIQALATLTTIANEIPDSCYLMMEIEALNLLESLFTNDSKHYTLLKSAGRLLTVFCQTPHPPSHEETIVRIISIAIEHDSRSVLIQVCLALSILSDRRLVAIGTQVTRLLKLLNHPTHQVVISALRTIGNYVRWGNNDEIQFMINQSLLALLGELLCHKYTIVRKEACWIISNVTAVANSSQILEEVIDPGLIGKLVRVIRHDEFEVKEVAASAISNIFTGSDEKQRIKDTCFPLLDEIRCSCRDDPRTVSLCSKLLELDKKYLTDITSGILDPVFLPRKKEGKSCITAHMASGSNASAGAVFAHQSDKTTTKKKSRRRKKSSTSN